MTNFHLMGESVATRRILRGYSKSDHQTGYGVALYTMRDQRPPHIGQPWGHLPFHISVANGGEVCAVFLLGTVNADVWRPQRKHCTQKQQINQQQLSQQSMHAVRNLTEQIGMHWQALITNQTGLDYWTSRHTLVAAEMLERLVHNAFIQLIMYMVSQENL